MPSRALQSDEWVRTRQCCILLLRSIDKVYRENTLLGSNESLKEEILVTLDSWLC